MIEGLTGITKSSYTGDDLISRQNIKYHTQLEAMGNGQYEEVEVAYKNDIESLPSADRPIGEWIDIANDEYYRCSLCGCESGYAFYYCPNCGADMNETRADDDEYG